jgi:hypothetical protein
VVPSSFPASETCPEVLGCVRKVARDELKLPRQGLKPLHYIRKPGWLPGRACPSESCLLVGVPFETPAMRCRTCVPRTWRARRIGSNGDCGRDGWVAGLATTACRPSVLPVGSLASPCPSPQVKLQWAFPLCWRLPASSRVTDWAQSAMGSVLALSSCALGLGLVARLLWGVVSSRLGRMAVRRLLMVQDLPLVQSCRGPAILG